MLAQFDKLPAAAFVACVFVEERSFSAGLKSAVVGVKHDCACRSLAPLGMITVEQDDDSTRSTEMPGIVGEKNASLIETGIHQLLTTRDYDTGSSVSTFS